MKNIGFIIVAAVFAYMPPVLAAYVGVPVPSDGEATWSVSADANFINSKEVEPKGYNESLEIQKLNFYGAKINYDFGNGINSYLKLGFLNTGEIVEGSPPPVVMKYDTAPYYGLGFNYVSTLENDILISADLQYYMLPLKLDRATCAGEPSILIIGGDIDVSELQLALIVGKAIKNNRTTFTPYAGFYFQRFNAKFNSLYFETDTWMVDYPSLNFQNKKDFGALIGLGVDLNEKVNVGTEMRFVVEKAFTLRVGYRF